MARDSALFGVKLYDKLLLHRKGKVFANWEAFDFTLELLFFNSDPRRQASPDDGVQRVDDRLNFPAFFGHLDGIAYIYQIGGDIDAFSVYQKVVVPDEMASLRARIGKTQPVHDIVQPPFEKNEQIGAGNALLAIRLFKRKPELLFRKTVGVFNFLLFTQLNAVIGRFSATTLSVFAGSVSPAVECAFIGITAVALQK